jgi:hypothetical protein
MRLLVALVALLTIPLFAWAKFDYKKCLHRSLDEANFDQIWGKSGIYKGLYDQKGIEQLNESGIIRATADLQLKLSDAIAGIPIGFLPAKVTKKRGADGQEQELVQIGIYPFRPEQFRDPKMRAKIIDDNCKRIADGAGYKFCGSAMEAKMGYFMGLYDKHDRKIHSMVDQALQARNPKWEDLGRGYDFTYEPDKVMPLASTLYVSTEEIVEVILAKEQNRQPRTYVRMVADGSGNPVGFALPIGSKNGNVDLYFIPNIGTKEQPLLLNPYFFVFGGKSASEWNSNYGVSNLHII